MEWLGWKILYLQGEKKMTLFFLQQIRNIEPFVLWLDLNGIV